MVDPGGTISVETIRVFADFSIRRGCGFVLLGISCVMLSFAFDLQRAFHAGAIMVALLAIALWIKSLLAPRRPYFRTELWVMLPERPKLGKPELQRLIGGVLAERFWWHAQAAAVIAGAFACLSLLVWLARQL
jgi:hypothetical protein